MTLAHTSDLELEVFGEFQPFLVPATDATRQDLYSVFLSRATAMGWSEAASRLATMVPRWGMAEAQLTPFALEGAGSGMVARVQVIPLGDPALPIPIQALVQCAVDSLRRLGALRLERLRLGIPLARHGGDERRPVAPTNWFHASPADDPQVMVAALTVGGVEVPLADEVARRRIQPFSVVSRNTPSDLRLRILSPEWSTESAAWVIAELADAAVRLGVRDDAVIDVWTEGKAGA